MSPKTFPLAAIAADQATDAIIADYDFAEGANRVQVSIPPSPAGLVKLFLVEPGGTWKEAGRCRVGASDQARILDINTGLIQGRHSLRLKSWADDPEQLIVLQSVNALHDGQVIDAFQAIPPSHSARLTDCKAIKPGLAAIGYLQDGASAVYDMVDFGIGASYFQAQASSPMGGIIRIQVAEPGSLDWTLVGECDINTTGSWEDLSYFNCSLDTVSGIKSLRLEFRQKAEAMLFDLYSFSFSPSKAGLQRETFGMIKAVDADSMSSGLVIEPSGDIDGGQALGAICRGNGIAFARMHFPPGTNYFEARIATPHSGTILKILVSEPDWTGTKLVGTIDVPASGSWRSWITVACDISPLQGPKLLEIQFGNEREGYLLNFNWFRFATVQRSNSSAVLSAAEAIPGSAFSTSYNIQLEPCSEGGHNISYVRHGSFIEFRQVDFGNKGFNAMMARVSSLRDISRIRLVVDGQALAEMPVGFTGDWQVWKTATLNLPRALTGIHTVRLVFLGDAGFLVNLSWFRFVNTAVQAAHFNLDIDQQVIKVDCPRPGTYRELLVSVGEFQRLSGIDARTVAPDLLQDGMVPADRLARRAGFATQWNRGSNTLEVRTLSRRHQHRERLRVSDGQLRDDRNQPLRGLNCRLDAIETPPTFRYLDLLAPAGLNVLRVCAEAPRFGLEVGDFTTAVDDLVDYCTHSGLYLILCPDAAAPGYPRDPYFLERFWQFYAPRYADRPNVSYELTRHQGQTGAPSDPASLALNTQLFRKIRALAPDTHLHLMAYPWLEPLGPVMQDIVGLKLPADTWRNASLAWVNLNAETCRLDEVAAGLRAVGIALLNTELPFDKVRQAHEVSSVAPDWELVGQCEKLGLGWIAIMRVHFLDSQDLFIQPMRRLGLKP